MLNIELEPVSSSTIHSIGYDLPSNTLRVRFQSKSTYLYESVPEDTYISLMRADSVGKFFGANIKDRFKTMKETTDGLECVYDPEASDGKLPLVENMAKELPPDATPETFLQIKSEGMTLFERVKALVINSADTYIAGQELLRTVQNLRKARAAWFKPHKDRLFEAHRAMCDSEREALAPLLAAEQQITPLLAKYKDEEERARRAEEQRIRQEQEEKARKEADQKAKEEAKKEAKVLKQEGRTEEAKAILKSPPPVAPAPVAPVVLPSQAPKAAGVSRKPVWTFRIINAELIPREYLMVDESKLLGIAKTMKDAAKIPGVEFFDDTTKGWGSRNSK